MKKVFVLINPVSGKRRSLKALDSLETKLKNEGIAYEKYLTRKDQNGARTLSKYLDSRFSDLVILGGDGTLNEVINGLKYDIPVGLVPTGSGNDYAKCFDFGKSLDQQIQTAIFGSVIAVDVGVCNERKFLNGVGVGFDGQIVADMLQEKTVIQGPAKYYYHVLKILGSYKTRHFSFVNDAGSFEQKAILMCVAKGTTFGGAFKLTPNARPDDGHLHVCMIRGINATRRFWNIPKLLSGKHGQLPEVQFFTTKSMTIQPNAKLNAHIDGEYFGQPPFEFSILPKHLKIKIRKPSPTGSCSH